MPASIASLLSIALGAVLVNNFVLSQFLGICPFMGVSKKVDTALGMGMAVIFVMGVASAVNWPINKFILERQYGGGGVYLPLITTNCAVLGVVLQNTQKGYTFAESLTYGIGGGIGFLVAIVLFASVRERMEFGKCPKSFEGFPIALVAASLIALAFMGFSGLKVW